MSRRHRERGSSHQVDDRSKAFAILSKAMRIASTRADKLESMLAKSEARLDESDAASVREFRELFQAAGEARALAADAAKSLLRAEGALRVDEPQTVTPHAGLARASSTTEEIVTPAEAVAAYMRFIGDPGAPLPSRLPSPSPSAGSSLAPSSPASEASSSAPTVALGPLGQHGGAEVEPPPPDSGEVPLARGPADARTAPRPQRKMVKRDEFGQFTSSRRGVTRRERHERLLCDRANALPGQSNLSDLYREAPTYRSPPSKVFF